jgi:hypothetical protein
MPLRERFFWHRSHVGTAVSPQIPTATPPTRSRLTAAAGDKQGGRWDQGFILPPTLDGLQRAAEPRESRGAFPAAVAILGTAVTLDKVRDSDCGPAAK